MCTMGLPVPHRYFNSKLHSHAIVGTLALETAYLYTQVTAAGCVAFIPAEPVLQVQLFSDCPYLSSNNLATCTCTLRAVLKSRYSQTALPVE